MAQLILVRHGISEWNKKGWWTGWKDPDLAKEGYEEAKKAGQKLRDIGIDKAYTADLKRTIQTLEEIKKVLKIQDIPTVVDWHLRERNYGDLAGKNKWDLKKQYGEEQFMKWRRGWDEPIPNGETLKDVYERLIPYYKKIIVPDLLSGKNVIISASGNSLRALVKYIENISDNDISKLEIGLGEVYVYKIDKEGKVVSKDIRAVNPKRGKI